MIPLPLFAALTTARGIHDFFHSTGFVIARDVAVLVAVVFWLALGFWVHRDARRRTGNSFLVLVATLLGLVPPFLGAIVYLLYRPSETRDDVRSRNAELQALERQRARSDQVCPVCSSTVAPDYLACQVCVTTLRSPCASCGAALEPLWQMCPYCASPVESAQADLDAALTAEVLRIVELEEAVPLIPQPEPQVADA